MKSCLNARSDYIFYILTGISENAEALKEYLTLVSEVLKETKHDILVCCLENDTEGDNIIAVSLTNITKKGETIPELEVRS